MPSKILIADSSPTIRNMAESLLTKHGHEVFLADDGFKTLEIVKVNRPDVLFLDFALPVLSIDQVLSELKQGRGSKPAYVIMLLDKDNEKRGRELQSRGVDAFIIKPFNPKELLEQVESLLTPKEKSQIKENTTRVFSRDRSISDNGLDILETSALLEDYEQSIPDSEKTGAHGFDWFLSELQKDITEEDTPGSRTKEEGSDGETGIPTKPEKTFVKYQPNEPPPAEKQEKDNQLRFEGEAPENFIEDLRRELEELESEEKIETESAAVETINPVLFDQVLSEIRSKISERVAQEVTKMITPEFMEKIFREEIIRLREQATERRSAVKEDIHF